MAALTADNPIFLAYVMTACLMLLKLMGQGWMTVYRMMKVDGGFLNPEDVAPGAFNRNPRSQQLDPDDYVQRSRRMHLNDLENIPAFLVAGLLLVMFAPPAWLAYLLLWGFVIARLAHAVAYVTKQSHEIRGTLFSVGSVSVIVMTLYVLVAAIAA